MIETFWQDLRIAWRSLGSAKGVAAAAIVMLALGIGANTAIFSVLRATSLRSSPVPDPDRVAIIDDAAGAARHVRAGANR